MAGKRTTLEEYKAPWEVDAEGNDIPDDQWEIDPGRLKKYLVNLLNDKEQAVEARETAQQELVAANEALGEKARKDESDEQRRERERQERDKELEEARAEVRSGRALRIALRQDKITKQQAEALADVLQGNTEEELDASAKALIDKFGLAKIAELSDDDGDDDEDAPAPRARPRRLHTPGDPRPASKPRVAFEDELASIPRPGGTRY
jgi:hypothetical protein